ncbi:MAG: hypothetical protein FWG28_05550 [Clostridiales bacterium]|nr:hypothetical protein [Clostridiales bacterium]
MSGYRAVMDIGTNSCRLIVAEVGDDWDVTHLRQMRVTRIGEGLGSGSLHISRAAMDRTLAALLEYKAMIEGFPVDKVVLMGTQALREADNGADFAAEVKERTGFRLEIISSRREACLSYAGAAGGLRGAAMAGPLVLDIGAGSTELFWEESAVEGVSAPIGALRLLESPLDGQGILAALRAGWGGREAPGSGSAADCAVDRDGGDDKRPLVAVGGTATTLGAIHLDMKVYDPEAMLGLRLSRARVEEVQHMLEGMTPRERLALPGMTPGREDVLPWGLRILLGAMDYCRRDSVVICDRDLLYGALYE